MAVLTVTEEVEVAHTSGIIGEEEVEVAHVSGIIGEEEVAHMPRTSGNMGTGNENPVLRVDGKPYKIK